uniref:precorrin-2 C(20)-methyltransferase n=1 Tax=Coprococcus catus TaxID=116085 RepID=UPI0022E4BBF6|nr:precorrin-2 C(20)-methyltransferase [Coprococcus catus]
MSGCLYSVGVGPGDPELMTLKAVKIIRNCQVLVLPAESKEKCVAYQIVRQAIPEIEDKTTVCLVMPMTKDKDRLEKSHREGTQKVAEVLDAGKDAAFLTLGDPTVYATSMYIHQRIAGMGYRTSIVSGVPSFCAAAAKLGVSLGEKQEQIHIIPASYDVEAAIQLPGTKILMKAGKKMPVVRQCVKEHHGWAAMVENCGMAEEHLWINAEDMPEHPGYYTLVIVKDRKDEEE